MSSTNVGAEEAALYGAEAVKEADDRCKTEDLPRVDVESSNVKPDVASQAESGRETSSFDNDAMQGRVAARSEQGPDGAENACVQSAHINAGSSATGKALPAGKEERTSFTPEKEEYVPTGKQENAKEKKNIVVEAEAKKDENENGENEEEGEDEDDEDDEDEEDDEEDFDVVLDTGDDIATDGRVPGSADGQIGKVRLSGSSSRWQRPGFTVPERAAATTGGGAPVARAGGVLAMLPTPTVQMNPNQKSVYDIEFAKLTEKPWLDRGADITEYFNYGFNEETWKLYCERQVQMRLEASNLAKIKTVGGSARAPPDRVQHVQAQPIQQKPDIPAQPPASLQPMHAQPALQAPSPLPSGGARSGGPGQDMRAADLRQKQQTPPGIRAGVGRPGMPGGLPGADAHGGLHGRGPPMAAMQGGGGGGGGGGGSGPPVMPFPFQGGQFAMPPGGGGGGAGPAGAGGAVGNQGPFPFPMPPGMAMPPGFPGMPPPGRVAPPGGMPGMSPGGAGGDMRFSGMPPGHMGGPGQYGDVTQQQQQRDPRRFRGGPGQPGQPGMHGVYGAIGGPGGGYDPHRRGDRGLRADDLRRGGGGVGGGRYGGGQGGLRGSGVGLVGGGGDDRRDEPRKRAHMGGRDYDDRNKRGRW